MVHAGPTISSATHSYEGDYCRGSEVRAIFDTMDSMQQDEARFVARNGTTVCPVIGLLNPACCACNCTFQEGGLCQLRGESVYIVCRSKTLKWTGYSWSISFLGHC